MLVGDGAGRAPLTRLAADLGIETRIRFAGKVSPNEIPQYLSVFDAAIVSTGAAEGFHYSPLKLREYLAIGLPVLAPGAGEIPEKFVENEHLVLYEVGNSNSMEQALYRLLDDAPLRARLSQQGRREILSKGTWQYELGAAMKRLEIEYRTNPC
jgi:glycosyltransferase involved in cell wall biosynthesis